MTGPELCHHHGLLGACPDCRRENDPTRAAELVLARILAQPIEQRRADRVRIQTTRRTQGIPTPAPRPARPTRARTAPAGPTQLELT